jgi:hypothetical protein
MGDGFALCTIYGRIFIKSFIAGVTWTRFLSPSDKIERVLVIFPSKTSSILNVGVPPNHTLNISSKVAFYTIIKPMVWISFFFAN